MKIIDKRTATRTKLRVVSCSNCGMSFGTHRNTTKNCSRVCATLTANIKRKKGGLRQCSVCDNQYHCSPSKDRNGLSKFCSRNCQFKNKKMGLPTGEYLGYDGYIVVSRTKDGRKQIKKHRLMMEFFIGRRLLPKEVVHHKDNNKLNNHLENLQIMSVREHNQHHANERSQCESQKETEGKPRNELASQKS